MGVTETYSSNLEIDETDPLPVFYTIFEPGFSYRSAASGGAKSDSDTSGNISSIAFGADAIDKAVLRLVNDPAKVAELALNGRQRVLDFLSHKRILPLQIASYKRASAAASQRNS